MSYSRNQVNKWLSSIDISNKNVLDIGAGPEEKWAKRKVKGQPKSYKTADIDDAFDCDYVLDLNAETIQIGSFDVVFCIEALEHVWNPIQAIKNLSLLTKEAVYIATPFINPHHDKWDYLRFTGEWYDFCLKKFGFRQVNITERVATVGRKLLQDFYTKEGLRVSKIRPEFGKYTYPIGYCVEGRK